MKAAGQALDLLEGLNILAGVGSLGVLQEEIESADGETEAWKKHPAATLDRRKKTDGGMVLQLSLTPSKNDATRFWN